MSVDEIDMSIGIPGIPSTKDSTISDISPTNGEFISSEALDLKLSSGSNLKGQENTKTDFISEINSTNTMKKHSPKENSVNNISTEKDCSQINGYLSANEHISNTNKLTNGDKEKYQQDSQQMSENSETRIPSYREPPLIHKDSSNKLSEGIFDGSFSQMNEAFSHSFCDDDDEFDNFVTHETETSKPDLQSREKLNDNTPVEVVNNEVGISDVNEKPDMDLQNTSLDSNGVEEKPVNIPPDKESVISNERISDGDDIVQSNNRIVEDEKIECTVKDTQEIGASEDKNEENDDFDDFDDFSGFKSAEVQGDQKASDVQSKTDDFADFSEFKNAEFAPPPPAPMPKTSLSESKCLLVSFIFLFCFVWIILLIFSGLVLPVSSDA